MTSLVEAIKKWRSPIIGDLKTVSVQWDLADRFIGKPINGATLKEISAYVDDKLRKYSLEQEEVFGPITPITNSAEFRLPSNDFINKVGPDGALEDEHVASTGSEIPSEGTAESPIFEDEHVGAEGGGNPSSQDYILRTTNYLDFSHEPESDRLSVSRIPEAVLTYDNFSRQKVMRFQAKPLEIPGNISYVTSYFLDYTEMTVNARILMAPGNRIIADSDWFDMGQCGSEGENEVTLRSYISEIINKNMAPAINSKRSSLLLLNDEERKALDLLREMVTEEEFRRYIKHGFLLIKGKNGHIYQVFRNHPHTKIWFQGKLVEEVCVRIKDKVPPTDNVVAFKAIIETDEDYFKSLGNVYRKKVA